MGLPVSPLIRTEMQTGRARQRRHFTATPTMASVRWRLNDSEAMLFEAWFRDVLWMVTTGSNAR